MRRLSATLKRRRNIRRSERIGLFHLTASIIMITIGGWVLHHGETFRSRPLGNNALVATIIALIAVKRDALGMNLPRSAGARDDLIRLYFASIHKYISRTVGECAGAGGGAHERVSLGD